MINQAVGTCSLCYGDVYNIYGVKTCSVCNAKEQRNLPIIPMEKPTIYPTDIEDWVKMQKRLKLGCGNKVCHCTGDCMSGKRHVIFYTTDTK